MRAQIHYPAPTFLIAGLCLAVYIFAHGVANAHKDGDDRKCVNDVNKDFEKGSKGKGKDIEACQKDWSKDDIESANDCLVNNDTKADKQGGKLKTKVPDKCQTYPADPNFAPVDPTDPNNLVQRAKDKEISLITWIFGTDLDGVWVQRDEPNNPDAKDEAKCQKSVGLVMSLRLPHGVTRS